MFNFWETTTHKLPLRSKKAERFEKLLGFARSHSIVTRRVTRWVSRAPPHHTLPAFLTFNGSQSESSS